MIAVPSIWPVIRPNNTVIALAIFAFMSASSALADSPAETTIGRMDQPLEHAEKLDSRPVSTLEARHPPTATESRIDTPSEDRIIYFPSHSTALADSEKEKLHVYADYLKQNPKKAVALIGRSDDLGSRSYNLAIAEERTSVTRDLLRSYGVAPRQIRCYSIGNEKKPTACRSKECKQRMRRVEVVIVP